MKKIFVLCLVFLAVRLFAEGLPCTAVPGDLFQSAASLFPKGLPEGARLAGAGRTLGVLIPKPPDGHTLLLIRGEKVVREYWLAAPKDRPFPRTGGFLMADNGNVVVVRSREAFVVYVNSTLTAVVDGELARSVNVTADKSTLWWTPHPSSASVVTTNFLLKRGFRRVREEEWPALLVSSEFDGSNQQVLLRLDEARLKAWDPFPPPYHQLLPAVRSDGKLWLAGTMTGEIVLADGRGRPLHTVTLQGTLKRPEDDPEIRKQRDEKDRSENEAWLAQQHSDATKKPPKQESAFFFNTSPLFDRVFARGRDLVVMLSTYEPPRGSIVVVRDGEEVTPCFQFPEKLRGKSDTPLQSTVTDDAVWFREPFGFIPWESLEALLEPEKKPEAEKR